MRSHWVRAFVLAASTGGLVALSACTHLRDTDASRHLSGEVACQPGQACPDHTRVSRHPTVHALAHDLDRLEKHIECYGSVTAKVPDVWGQARLTQYREDFEHEMYKELGTFKAELQGNTARSDQSYLAAALSLGLAAQPSAPVIGSLTTGSKSVETPKPLEPLLTSSLTRTAGVDPDSKNPFKELKLGLLSRAVAAPAVAAPAVAEADPVKPPDPGKSTDALPDAEKVIARSDKVELKKYEFADKAIGIEPTERLAQQKRYLDLLAQLRRENEGGDTADAPGYQLNLIRLPVSVLPGAHTDRAHGAEVTFTIDPVLGDDLLPTTFRRMVQNDLRNQMGLPLAQLLNNQETVAKSFTPEAKEFVEGLGLFNHINQTIRGNSDAAAKPLLAAYFATLFPIDFARLDRVAAQIVDPKSRESFKLILKRGGSFKLKSKSEWTEAVKWASDDNESVNLVSSYLDASLSDRTMTKLNTMPEALKSFTLKVATPPIAFAPGQTNKTGFPTSQLIDVYGLSGCFQIAFDANTALRPSIIRQNYAHLPDIQGYLQQEAAAAYAMLSTPGARHLWDNYCTHDLVLAVQTLNLDQLQVTREQFRVEIDALTGTTDETRRLRPYNAQGRHTTTAALAWAIIVDSALLNDRLVRDMRESATAKGLPSPCPPDCWPLYFLPDPPAEARQQFNAYVKMRWPVYVFALDPMVQEQNIADSLSTRRETQLALAVGFTNGAVSAKTFLNAARRLESEAQTIALNRTQVGFAHGENTFGWRFYPRFQTMPTQTNFTVLFRDQIIGGPTTNATLRQRRLEPGPRECVALVVMPSFVPYVTVDSVSNWFRLADPKCKLLDHTESADLSRTVRSLERCEHTVTDAECYRDGELKRLQTRVQQLASRLPAQTLTVPVPVVNTLGGFEMFSNGTTDLAPELYGWYGAPGVSANHATTLFLVGDHFSPLRTRAIVGNSDIGKGATPPALRMLSRQVMQVTVEAGALTPFTDPTDGVRKVQAHVATPYGVSRELLIPLIADKVAEKPAAPAEGFSVSPDAVTVTYNLVPSQKHVGTHRFDSVVKVDPIEFEITWVDATGSMPNAIEVTFNFEYAGNKLPVPARTLKRIEGSDNKFVMAKADVTTLAEAVIRAVGADGIKPGANPLDAPFVTKSIEVTPGRDVLHVVQPKATGNQLTLKLVGQYAPPVGVK